MFLDCRQNDGTAKWYKFDDGEVTECKMDDEEEMKTQCFGGDYMGEVRNSFRQPFLSYCKLIVSGASAFKQPSALS